MGEPAVRRPWRMRDEPEPTVWCWPPGRGPGLYVRSRGTWRYASFLARHVYADDSVACQVAVNLGIADMGVAVRTYSWPQPGLRVVHRSPVEPVSWGVGEFWSSDPRG